MNWHRDSTGRIARFLLALGLASSLAFLPIDAAFAAEGNDSAAETNATAPATTDGTSGSTDATTTATSASATANYAPLATDTAGSVLTFDAAIDNRSAEGDVYWVGDTIAMHSSKVGNDLVAGGRYVTVKDSSVASDVRMGGLFLQLSNMKIHGNATLLGATIEMGSQCTATGVYCFGLDLSYSGTSQYFVGYGRSVVFDGVVNGDVSLSAQDIVIGPNAQVTGTLYVRSGQQVDIPATAHINKVDTTLSQPNTIDQATKLRAAIAPYFQAGTLLFIVVSAIILGLVMLGLFDHKLTEASRLLLNRPVAIILLGIVSTIVVVALIGLGLALIFTIPAALILLLLLIVVTIASVPFAGSSLMLLAQGKIKRSICVIFGAGVASALLFVPVLNVIAFTLSVIYLMGYVTYTLFAGHDREHDKAKKRKQGTGGAASSDGEENISSKVGETPDGKDAKAISSERDEKPTAEGGELGDNTPLKPMETPEGEGPST